MKTFTLKQLALYRDKNGSGKIYLAIKGEVFDVSASRHLYGQGGVYETLAGCEIARALAMFELDEAGSNRTKDLDEDQLVSLKEWTDKFRTKYKTVGQVVGPFALCRWKTLVPVAAFAAGAVAVVCIMLRKK